MTTASIENVNFSIMDLYDKIYLNKNGFYEEGALVLNCPTGKPCGETCPKCVYRVHPNVDVIINYYNSYCNRKFTDILDGWNIKTDRILNIVKNEYGIITKVTVLKNRKQKTFIYPPSKIGDTLSKLVYNTKSVCIVVLNQRTRIFFKIVTYQQHRNVPIEGYQLKNNGRFSNNRLPIYYANKPEWIIITDDPEDIIIWESEG